MPEYSSTTITPADGVQVPSMNGSTSGNFLLSALRDYILASKGQANGLASLGSDGKLTLSQLPDLADDVIVVASYAVLPATGTAGKIYITADNNKMYRWDSDLSTPDYVELSVDLSEYAKLTDLAAEETARETADANLNNAISQLDHRVENLEQAHGSYVVQNYKDGSTTPSGKGKWCVVEGVEGVSRVENNHLNKSFSPSTTINNVTFTNNGDGSWTVSTNGTASGTAYVQCCNDIPALGHKWLISGCPSGGNGLSGFTLWDASNSAYDNGSGVVFSPTNAINVYIRVASGTSIPTPIVYWPVLTDLNIYFGTSDLSFLGSTDAQKTATIQTNYPHLLTPSDYGTRIVDAGYTGVRAYSINIWDEESESGKYNSSTGAKQDSAGQIRSKNFIPVEPSTQYYFGNAGASTIIHNVYFFGANKNFLSADGWYSNSAFTTPSGCYYITFDMNSAYGTTYNNDIQICLNTATDKAIYHPHILDTLSLTFTGKSAGSVYDSCELNVEVEGVAKKRTTQRIGEQDLSQIAFTYNSSFASWRSNSAFSLAKPPASNDDVANIMLAGFVAIKGNDVASTAVMSIAMNIGGNIWINNGSSTTPPSGTMRYELATESVTLSDPLIDNTLLTEAGGRMATVQTGTVVDGSFDLGFITL